ncbi:DNA-dependent metalloprotease SPRTN-like isoform X1 [Schistocerca gregaria]|uniref:DNA-dependent metalloprotease SPRTN-like isoform X1 n=2 Tax=Schistocerca gregaria TaxID=7010 RepID=UPI00211E59D1|nr:DNA-dependent metalloprotease SPRTN-like isoform X1 [Schistocerca gregaria]
MSTCFRLGFGGEQGYPTFDSSDRITSYSQSYLKRAAMSKLVDTPPQGKTYSAEEGMTREGAAGTSLVDPSLEYTDPTPDIHALFLQFNDRFFRGRLAAVEVKWSSRMTSNVGVCTYEGEDGLCTIRLSEPLLKLRPRKDLVETLLHEMIHAYLFVRNKDRDRSEHGPEFHKYMRRINREAGTSITVFHEFDDEVEFYRQHWYRCDGPCLQWRPCFGTVKRYSRCPPGPRDSWWRRHQQLCGGTFRKIHGPEGYVKPTKEE